MKKVSFILILFMLTLLPCYSVSFQAVVEGDKIVFVYHIPDEEENEQTGEVSSPSNQEESEDIISDDVTADTSHHKISEDSEFVEDEVDKNKIEDEDYEIGDMYGDVLKGYAQYTEGQEDEILLEDIIELPSKIEITRPFRIAAANYTQLKTSPTLFEQYSQFNGTEYSITPLSKTHSKSIGKGFSAGTEYSQGIDYGELEQTSGIFSRYQYKRFAIETSYKKTVNSTNNNYNDNVYITPEVKLNDYFTLKERLSNDFENRRNKAEFILSVNPFGKKDYDRMRLNFGVSRTYYQASSSFKDQVNFSTSFKF